MKYSQDVHSEFACDIKNNNTCAARIGLHCDAANDFNTLFIWPLNLPSCKYTFNTFCDPSIFHNLCMSTCFNRISILDFRGKRIKKCPHPYVACIKMFQ